jgi:hypothetical protein
LDAYHASHGKTYSKGTKISGPPEDPVVESRVESEQDGEELVVVIAGGMTSQLTYDGVDVCASRVAFEVGIESSRLMMVGSVGLIAVGGRAGHQAREGGEEGYAVQCGTSLGVIRSV